MRKEIPTIVENAIATIFNKSGPKKLFVAPSLLKHRIILTLSYSAGLRSKELINLKIPDIDFERKTIHIGKSKYNKDRIVPLSDYIAKGIKKAQSRCLAIKAPQSP